MKNRILILAISLVCLSVGSLCPKDEETEVTGPVSFTILPVDLDAIFRATPMGNVNPPGHVFPTNHVYFYLQGTDAVEVRAPAGGTIQTVYYNEGSDDYRLEFYHTSTCFSYLDHIENIVPGVWEGATVRAGDPLGYGDPSTGAIDIGVVDYEFTRNFITPGRYHEFYLHCGDPYLYFTDELRTQLYTKNVRIEEPRGGKIDYDIDGRLCGNWFLEGTPVIWEASSYLYSDNQLTFVYDLYEPSEIHIACGGTLDIAPFDRPVVGNSPDPSTVSISSGLIKYDITVANPLKTPGVLLVQMLDAQTIRVEVFPNITPLDVSGFTASAQTYIR